MTRKTTTISIDEDILALAKREIPNVSIFVEDCLKAYLGFDNSNIRTVDENLQTIKQCLLSIHYATLKNDVEQVNKTYDTKQMNEAWIKVWGNYRNNHNIVSKDLNQASMVLGVSSLELKNLLATLDLELTRSELVKASNWEFAKTYIK